MDVGGRSTSTPGAEVGAQEVGGGGGAGDGGAAEEMDQDGSDVGGSSQGGHGGTTTPNGWQVTTCVLVVKTGIGVLRQKPKSWDQMAVAQRQNWHKHRRKKEIKAWAASRDLSRFAR